MHLQLVSSNMPLAKLILYNHTELLRESSKLLYSKVGAGDVVFIYQGKVRGGFELVALPASLLCYNSTTSTI